MIDRILGLGYDNSCACSRMYAYWYPKLAAAIAGMNGTYSSPGVEYATSAPLLVYYLHVRV